MPIPRFILNDENQENSYGFYVATEGINLSRFETNPVMLGDHSNKNADVLGKWSDWAKENGQLTSLPVFDDEDKKVANIKGKVDRGFIKGASMGILFDPDKLQLVAGKVILTECELYEASIVPVPSNRKALTLYNKQGDILSEQEVKEACLSISSSKPPKESNTKIDMKKIVLSVPALMALGLNDQPTDGLEQSVVETKIAELSAQNATLTAENTSLTAANTLLKETAEATLKASVEAEVEVGFQQGKFSADKKEGFVNLGIANRALLTSTLAAIPAKKSFSAGVVPTSNPADSMTMDEFQKLSVAKQLAFKQENPEGYKALLNQK